MTPFIEMYILSDAHLESRPSCLFHVFPQQLFEKCSTVPWPLLSSLSTECYLTPPPPPPFAIVSYVVYEVSILIWQSRGRGTFQHPITFILPPAEHFSIPLHSYRLQRNIGSMLKKRKRKRRHLFPYKMCRRKNQRMTSHNFVSCFFISYQIDVYYSLGRSTGFSHQKCSTYHL